jgi:hypothetical protein
MTANWPFFIVGCVRSGTTLLRDALRLHPALACPEETQFFRWPEPLGSRNYARVLLNNDTLQHHRKLDGISEEEFAALLDKAGSRGELYESYMRLYIERSKPAATRWFDKSPQNIYGVNLIAAGMPAARFVHIVRDPVQVVASLRLGKIVHVPRLVGACNYWNDAVDNIAALRALCPQRLHELRYEDLMANPMGELRRLFDFIEQPFEPAWFDTLVTRESRHEDGAGGLNAEEVERVLRRCYTGCQRYGYSQRRAQASDVDQRLSSVPGDGSTQA